MAAPVSALEFLDLVRKSCVADAKRLDARLEKLRADNILPDDPLKLADVLVADGLLTRFQTEYILQGRYRGFSIGKYKLLDRIGAGGMGRVYLCEHPLMRRRVAVKVLPLAKACDDSARERFFREARAIAVLDHPNIVHAYDIDQDGELLFLVMEYVDGFDLQTIVERSGPLDVVRACHYIRQAALGLEHAREQGLVHRDIKPGNILVDRSGIAKILDMGLARFFHDKEDNLTKQYNENVLGTTDYLSPEQAKDSHNVDTRTDIYGLGATFYFVLAGETPFGPGSFAQKLLWHLQRPMRPLAQFRHDVRADVEAIIRKMLAKDPADRYQTPAEVAAALSPFAPADPPAPPELAAAHSTSSENLPNLPATTPVTESEAPPPAATDLLPTTQSPGLVKQSPSTLVAPTQPISATSAQVTASLFLPGASSRINGAQSDAAQAPDAWAADTVDPAARVDTAHDGRKPTAHELPVPSPPAPMNPAPAPTELVSAEPANAASPPTVAFRCSCGRTLRARTEFTGQKFKCPACKLPQRVPGAAEPASPTPNRTASSKPAADEKRPADSVRSERKVLESTVSSQPRRRSDHDRTPPKKALLQSQNVDLFQNKWVLVGVGVAGALGLIAILSLYLFSSGEPGHVAVGKAKQNESIAARQQATANLTGVAADATMRGNLKKLCAGLLSMNDALGRLPPPGYSRDFMKPNAKALLSWRVAILPFIDEGTLFRQFKLDEPWDSAHNMALLPKMPKIFQTPAKDSDAILDGYTRLQMVTGPGTPFPTPTSRAAIPESFVNGAANAIMIVEASEPVPWTKPADVTVDVTDVTKGALPKLGAFSSRGFYAGLADGTASFIDRSKISDRMLRQAFHPSQRADMPSDWYARE